MLVFFKYSICLLSFLFTCASSTHIGNDVKEEEKTITERLPIYDSKRIEDEMILDNQLEKMTLNEKIGQLFWMAVYSNKGNQEIVAAENLIKRHHIGGVTWFRDTKKKSSPAQQLRYTNRLQKSAKYPLIVSIDGEWGLSMRLDSTVTFPRQLALGAISDNQIVEEFGKEVGREMKRMGIHVNFAPVIDVNNNPNNPVINDRSFGENKYNVAEKGIAYMEGMHKAGILATAKHFPGHGDTDTDSHLALPIINHDAYRLQDIEMYPFQQLINQRIGAVMVAHLSVPALDPTPNRPTTLSKEVVTDLLQYQLGFDGLIITDALNMQGVAKFYPAGTAEVEALKAGNDILLYSQNIPVAIKAIQRAVASGELTEERINLSVKKILSAKRWLGILNGAEKPTTKYITEDLNQPSVQLLNAKLYENAITLVRNSEGLPFTDLSTKRIATVSIDNGKRTPFQNAMSPYASMKHFTIASNASASQFAALKAKLANYNTVIVGLKNKSSYARKNFGISNTANNFINQLNQEKNTILAVFGNPYSLEKFTTINTLICSYDGSREAQKATAEAIFGVNPFRGQLPVGVSGIAAGTGEFTQGGTRLKYTIPQALGYSSDVLYKVDSLALDAIKMKATPGCQIIVAKNNKVIYHKAFGYHTYAKRRKVKKDDLFDVASVTKITGTLPLVMEAYDKGLLSTTQRMDELLPQLRNTNKADMLVGEVLSHTAGLKSWIPFYKSTMTKNGGLRPGLYRRSPAPGYQQVSKSVFIKESYERDSLFNRIINSPTNAKGRYVYSDLGYYFFKRYLEDLHGQPLEDYHAENFAGKLGAPSLGYNPLKRFPVTRIVPSEKDTYYRNEVIRGYVHDMGAAMQGGVGGHAGIFATTNDLAIYLQLLLNKGSYGGVQFFQPSTVDYFTQKYNYNSRRALGFDKPEVNPNKSSGPTCYYVSPQSYGHMGFTGTYAWADPVNDILYVFLSNRTYPTMKNKKINRSNLRLKIQEEVWRALDPTCKPFR